MIENVIQKHIDSKHIASTEVPSFVTESHLKSVLYSIDPYYREGWEDSKAVIDNIEEFSSQYTGIVFKPDAIVGRKIFGILDILQKNALIPVACHVFYYNETIIREDWRYQYNVATRDRMEVVDLLLKASPSLFVILKKDFLSLNAKNSSQELRLLKGHSNPRFRKAGEIRYEMGVINSLLNFIHTPDEPADFFRSLGLYFDKKKRVSLLSSLQTEANDYNLTYTVQYLYDAYPEEKLDLSSALSNIITVVNDSLINIEAKDEITMRCKEIQDGLSHDWRSVLEFIAREGLNVNLWDLIIVSTSLVNISLPELKPIID